DERGVSVLGEGRDTGGDVPRIKPIVVGEHHHVLAATLAEQRVEVGRRAEVAIVAQVPQPRVPGDKRATELLGAILGAVIRSGHRFAMGMKGVTDRVLRDRCLALADELGAESVELAASGLDLDSYHEVATRIEADRLCFLNSSSEILADAWLSALTSALDGGA